MSYVRRSYKRLDFKVSSSPESELKMLDLKSILSGKRPPEVDPDGKLGEAPLKASRGSPNISGTDGVV